MSAPFNWEDVGPVYLYVTYVEFKEYKQEGPDMPHLQFQLFSREGSGKNAKKGLWQLVLTQEGQPAPCGRMYTTYATHTHKMPRWKMGFPSPQLSFPKSADIEASYQIKVLARPRQVRCTGQTAKGRIPTL